MQTTMNLFNNTSRGALLVRILLRAPIAAAGLGAILAAAAIAAPPPKDVTLDEPISVEIVNEAPVAVEISSAAPLPVESVDDALREPYGKDYVVIVQDGFAGGNMSFAIPAGKRLVVETISFDAIMMSEQSAKISMSFGSGANSVVASLSPQFAMPWGSTHTRYTGTHAMRFYVDAPADADGALYFYILRDSGDGATSALHVAVMGYLVDL